MDHSTKRAAKTQAHQIKEYWRERGVNIKTEVIKVATVHHSRVFCVRSNLAQVMAGPS